MKKLLVSIIYTMVSLIILSSGVFLSVGEAAEVTLYERDIVLLSGKYDKDCLAVGRKGIYAIEEDMVRTIVSAAMIHSPTPILSMNHSYICALSLHGNGGKAAVVYDLNWKRGNTIPLPEAPTAWAFAPSEAMIAVATGTGVCELIPSVTRITPSPIVTPDPIRAIAYSPTGNFLLLTTEREYWIAKTSTMELVGALPLAGQGPAAWLDDARIAIVTGEGEPDSFLDLYTLSPDGMPTGAVERIASFGTPGRLENLSVSPFGDLVAGAVRIDSPVDYFQPNPPVYWQNAVQFFGVAAHGQQRVPPVSWPQFAWAPVGERYCWIAPRIHQAPDLEPAGNQAKRDWALYVGEGAVEPRGFQAQAPLYVSEKPLHAVVWSKDGTRLYIQTVFGRNIAQVVSVDVP